MRAPGLLGKFASCLTLTVELCTSGCCYYYQDLKSWPIWQRDKHVEEACWSQWPVSLYINKNKIALVQTPHTIVIQMRLPGKKTYQVIRMLWICLGQQWYRYPLELVGQKYMIYVCLLNFQLLFCEHFGETFPV